MNVLSLFDGIGCAKVALDKIGFNVDTYYACEIDSKATAVTAANYPEVKHLGNIENWRNWDIDWSRIGLIVGGSPCQGFSLIGKQLAFDDPRSKLFFTYMDIVNYAKAANPKVFYMLENVKMKREYLDVITEQIGVNPVFINSKDYSACSRPRYYWFNWEFTKPYAMPKVFGDVVDYSLDDNHMSDGWHAWWIKNHKHQLSKQYSKLVFPFDQGITMVSRQYANWKGNLILSPSGRYRKPTKQELSALIGAPRNYLDGVSQRQAEVFTGNGWTIDVVARIFQQIPA